MQGSKKELARYIDITGFDLKKLVMKVYDLSGRNVFGMGALHARPGSLPTAIVQELLGSGHWDDCGLPPFARSKRIRIHMDYVLGRACKFYVYEVNDRLYIDGNTWYDHSQAQLDELIDHVGIRACARIAELPRD